MQSNAIFKGNEQVRICQQLNKVYRRSELLSHFYLGDEIRFVVPDKEKNRYFSFKDRHDDMVRASYLRVSKEGALSIVDDEYKLLEDYRVAFLDNQLMIEGPALSLVKKV